MSTDHARILIIDNDGVLLTALADTLKIRLGHIVIDTATPERMAWRRLNQIVTILS
jgi:hypothetical protein